MAKYLLIFKMQITNNERTASQTFGKIVDCSPNKLKERINYYRERAKDILASKCDSDVESSVSLIQVVPL